MTLSNGETGTFGNLKVGTYTISEDGTGSGGSAQISGYSLSVNGSGQEIMITDNSTISHSIKNTYTKNAVTGSLKVTNTVTGAPSGSSAVYNYTVIGPNNYRQTFPLASGASKSFTGLKPGDYTVTLDEDSAKIPGYRNNVTGNGSTVTIAEGSTSKSVTVSSSYEKIYGSIKVSVVVNGIQVTGKTYSCNIKGGSVDRDISVLLNSSSTASDLPVGEYTVTLSDASVKMTGYSHTLINNGSSVVIADDDTDKEITIYVNYSEIKGSLTVENKVTGAPSDSDAVYTYTVTGPNKYSQTFTLSKGESIILGNLKLGTYKVTLNETGAKIPGYTYSCSNNGKSVTLSEDAATSYATVTSTYSKITGSLKITNNVSGIPSGSSPVFTYTVTGPGYSKSVSVGANKSRTLSGLKLGQYTVTLSVSGAEIYGYSISVTGNNSSAVLSEDATSKTVSVSTSYSQILGKITVNNRVNNAPSNSDAEYNYTISGPVTRNVKIPANSSLSVGDQSQ